VRENSPAENITELFFAKLKASVNPGVVLAQFYGTVMGIEVGRSEIMQLNRLIKFFGRTSVFFSIVDIARRDDFKEFPFGLLYKICKDKLEASTQAEMAISSLYSLDRRITDMFKDIDKTRKIDPSVSEKYFPEGTDN
jgi:hypothetical protein